MDETLRKVFEVLQGEEFKDFVIYDSSIGSVVQEATNGQECKVSLGFLNVMSECENEIQERFVKELFSIEDSRIIKTTRNYETSEVSITMCVDSRTVDIIVSILYGIPNSILVGIKEDKTKVSTHKSA